MQCKKSDFLVIGSGIAGLYYALTVADHGKVIIVTKNNPDESSTRRAQGGIAAVLDKKDSFESHISDTLKTGAGLGKVDIVEMTIKEGPNHIKQLMQLGLKFTRDDNGSLHLGREGGHSHRRVASIGDFVGKELENVLLHNILHHPNVSVLDYHLAIDLIVANKTCGGAYVLNLKTNEIITCAAKNVFLAAGGAGQVYRNTSNPNIATGDGIAMAYRAGVPIANMEFFQFHPTGFHYHKDHDFLVSEVLRGEGGVLRLEDGTDFMAQVHSKGSLAPRDIISQTIDDELKRTGKNCVYLDMTHFDESFLRNKFPRAYEKCSLYGINMKTEWIPVVPVAHYCCGGIVVDKNGQTSIKNLSAAGENAYTGFHGACRLASNSLLEALVFASRAALYDINTKPVHNIEIPSWNNTNTCNSAYLSVKLDEIRRLMWNYVGIVRSDKSLEYANRRITLINEEIINDYSKSLVTKELIELYNIAIVAHIIIKSAICRKESCGTHKNIDYPNIEEKFRKDISIVKEEKDKSIFLL